MHIHETEEKVKESEINVEEITSIIETAKQNSHEYYNTRGLTEKTIDQYHLGYLPDGYNKFGQDYQIVIPVSEKHIILRSTADHKNERYKNIGSTEIFNSRYLEDPALTNRKIFITEGVFDALSFEEIGYQAIALNSVNMSNKFSEAIDNNVHKLKDKLFVLALDNDQSGRQKTEELKKKLDNLKLTYFELSLNGYKDVNEYFVNDKEALINSLKNLHLAGTTYEYLKEQFINDQNNRANEKAIKTCLTSLDSVLGGGMYPGFYVLGSVSSLGKTALALQFADKIAEQGHGVLFFSLEMSRHEMTCRSIARMIKEHEDYDGITTTHIINNSYDYAEVTKQEVYQEALKKYKNVTAKNITMIEGSFEMSVDKIKRRIKEFINMTGKTPVVFIDYLQVIEPPDYRLNDKQQMDKIVKELKQISIKYNLPLLAISSFNRGNYYNDVSFVSFKESGLIEYTADVVLGIQLRKNNNDDIDELKSKEPRPIDLVLLKNRRGRSYAKFPLHYYAKQNYFEED